MTKQEIIDAAMQIADGIGRDPHDSPILDSDMTAEDLLPHAFRFAYKQLLKSGEMRLQDTIASHTITLTANVGALPAGVLTEDMELSFMPDYPYASYLRYYPDYQRTRFDTLLSYYTANNGNFYFSGLASPGNGNVTLHAPSIPAIPINPATDISMPDGAENAVIMALAMALRGEVQLIA